MRRLFRSKITWITLALVAVVGAVLWLRMPLATLTLDDGTKICLQKITYGKQHPFDLSDDPNEPAWLRIWHKISRRSASFETEAEAPVYHFTVSSKRRRSSGEPAITRIQTSFADGRIVEHRGLTVFRTGDEPTPNPVMKVGSGSWFDPDEKILCRGTLAMDGEKFFLSDPYFDRRAQALKVRIKAKGKWYDWVLPNPMSTQAWTEWKSDSLPIERKHKELTFIVRGWRTGKDGLPELDAELLSHGKPVTSDYSVETTFEDVTGNVSRSAILSRTEGAWKAKVDVLAGWNAPLNENHRFDFRGLQVPKPGEFVILEVPIELRAQRVVFMAIVGAGSFAFANGKPVPPRAENNVGLSIQKIEDGWRADVKGNQPKLIVVDAIRRGTEDEDPNAGAEFYPMIGEDLAGGSSFTMPDTDLGLKPPMLRYEVRCIGFLEEPKPGLAFDLMAIWPAIFRQEFYIKPPAAAAR